MKGIWIRSFLIVILCGILSTSLIDRDLADGGPVWWVVFLAGLVVIAVGSALVEIRLRRRDALPGATESNGDAERR